MSDGQRFHELDDALTAVGGETGAAEAHGLLCGMFCGPQEPEAARWIAHVLAGASAHGDAARGCLAALTEVYEQTRAALENEALEFQPLLPADDEPLETRARALGEWCEGFLFGLGVAGSEREHLPKEAAEVVNDLGQIARIDPDAGADEDSEQAYTELVEYLRVATLLVRENTATPAANGESGPRDRLH
ncbi:UPF0149 family protein [Sediminicurvatus halobius]|uniref:YecA family protein n=1 Tax=Sediminicurvatus halobius TaxID=2182432 RepID=A0A2U2N1G4_9GAMM|nr:UPF0149 family protein [Spiribacter halobius]PWG62970.1 YecA family protein [Spiribacter halobius]UEX77484.1 UPF0149 family protein [Spiribacter halobius]